MPVLPPLQAVLDAMNAAPAPPAEGLSTAELRARAHAAMDQGFLALSEPGPEVAAVEEHRVPVEGGEITVRAYTPPGEGPFPCHVYFHGGGFWLGTIDQFDAECRETCVGAGCVVVSVDYRLAPEHAFPTAAEDCYAATRWVADHAGDLGVDPSRLSVGGASAGGNMAAVVSLMARDRGGPPIVCQILEIPVTDLTMGQPSVRENGSGYMLTTSAMEQYVGFYVPDAAERTNPYASPLLADDLGGLPPALVMTAEFDPLRDEGEAYARRLEEAGVPTVHRRWDGQFHGSQRMGKLIPDENAAYRDLVNDTLRQAYGTTP
jgi:acetyl esterase